MFFSICQVEYYRNILRLSCRPLSFALYKAFFFFKKKKAGQELISLPHFIHDFCRKISLYILLTDQVSLSGCLYFVRYWVICVVIVCYPGCDVINFEINLIFLIKSFFLHDQSSKNSNILRTKRDFKPKKSIHHFLKAFYWSK